MKRPRKQEICAPADVNIPGRLGGGTLKEQVIRDLPSKEVVSYTLVYINRVIFSGDNGRVLGFDNSHAYSHRHHLGSVTRNRSPATKSCTTGSSGNGKRSPSGSSTEKRYEETKITLADLAIASRRNASAVSRDVSKLSALGLVKVVSVSNEGHGQKKIVLAAASTISINASIT